MTSVAFVPAWIHGADQETDTAVVASYETVSRYNEAKYKGFSHLVRKSPDDALRQFAGESIGLLSIDGNHAYETVKRTFESWLPKVKPGGVILISDISLRGGEIGAWRLFDELQGSHPHFAFRGSNGMGVIARSAKDADRVPFLSTLFHAPRDQQERIRRYYSLCSERLEMAARLGASGTADTGSSLFQVFRSQAGEYEAAAELSHVISPGGWVNLLLDLPRGIGDKALRLDVANRPAVIDIATLTLRKADGKIVWTWNPRDITDLLRVEGTAVRMPVVEFFRVLSLGGRPHVYLPEFRGSTFEQPLSLEVRLRVDLQLTAVQEMNQKWADLEKAKAELEVKRASDSDTVNPAAVEAAVAKAKSETAKHLAQARIEHETKVKQLSADAEARLEAQRADLQNQILLHATQLEDERRAHQTTILERDNAVAQQPRMLQEISIAQGNVEELKAEVERLSMELSHVEYDLTELRKLNARISAALEEERSVRANMQDSSSWQLTKPFRAVGDLFGPRKKY